MLGLTARYVSLVMTGETGPKIGLPPAPCPLPQASSNLKNGSLVYPDPALVISTPKTSPTALTTTFPVAPEPPPPHILTSGGPQKRDSTLQVSSIISLKSKSKSKLSGSTD